MLGRLLNHIIRFFYERKFLFALIFVALLVVFIGGIFKIHINDNIFSVLPKGSDFSKFSKLIDEGNLSNKVVFSINVKDNDDIEEITNTFKESLTKYTNGYLKDIVIRRPNIEENVYNYLYSNFPALINKAYYYQIKKKIDNDSIRFSLADSKRNLLSPGGILFKKFILKDPIYLTATFFKQLNKNANFSNLNIDNGYVFSKDKNQLLITAKITHNVAKNKKNVALYKALSKLKNNWNNKYNNTIDYFGTFQIAAENEIQIKKDTFLTLSITLIIILLILFIYYRKILIPIYFMLPVIFGGLFALGMIGYFKPEISGIAIATGAIVFGVIMDFSFHFFTHLRHTNSISKTIQEIAVPLLTGSFTTIMAFWALLFTNSPILQDFGLFAALSITGAIVFTLILLPILLYLFHFKYANISSHKKEFIITIPDKFRKVFIIVIIILTGIFAYFSFNIQFDGNLDNLSIHSQKLKNKEKELTGINPNIEQKLFVFAEGKTYENANQINYILYQKLQKLQAEKKIKSFFSVGKFIIPDSVSSYRFKYWNNFWKSHQKTMFTVFNKTADSLGFDNRAFSSFKQWISSNSKPTNPTSIINALALNDFINQQDTQTTFITTLVVNKALVKEVQQSLSSLHGITEFNRSNVATQLLATVQLDFNFILFITTLLVFVTLLLIYGRIEMALFTFMPMVISWVWILGIAALLNIKFNFINVIIGTFIFGLGDDYSIFVTDGLLQKYKYKKDNLGSYNIAIILSALTTMVGTGILFFARHPAIHSVGVISVLGILCILVISIIVQPFLFNIFIQNRVDYKKPPLTFIAFIISVFEFSWFVFGCIVSWTVLLILLITPISKKRKRFILNAILSYSAWSVMYSAFHVRKRIFTKENLDFKNPSIIIANHTSFLDILLLLMLNPKIIIIVKDWVYKSVLFGFIVKYAGYIYIEDNFDKNVTTLKRRIQEGYSIVIFPEGSRSTDDVMRRFHKGAFFLAQELGLDITPVLIHGASFILPKTEYFVKNGYLNLKILPRIKADDASWGATFGKRTKAISTYFKQEYLLFKDEQENGKTLFSRVFANYVYKGPILEWYLKVKWKLEVKNYEHYCALLKDKSTILDIGCGYGYLSYFLHYKNPKRKIVGIDYDKGKITIAQNGFDKTTNLTFEHTDITTYNFKPVDAILLNDILHYCSKEKQIQLLEKCAANINKGGVILIRDGIIDLKEKHQTTRLTEKLSTQLFGFNKKVEKFYFFSADEIRTFAKEHNFSCQMENHSNKTSNVLFTLKKT